MGETAPVAGLEAPAEIIIDCWGIAHIFAANQRDAFFLQGWNAARDRLWQIDLWRKRGLGRLSASFGPAYAEQDRAARLLLYRGDMDAEWAAYGPGARAGTEAFVAGINAFIAEVGAGDHALPVEFVLSRSEPEPWTAEDVVRIRSHSLTRNLASEATRANVAAAAGLDADRIRQRLTPEMTPTLPGGLAPVPQRVLESYRLGVQEVSFARPGELEAGEKPDLDGDGSNNWVIAPSRAATGRPILANDPHRALGAPSLRYIVHMSAPGLDVIGAGEPAMPGVSIGHNGKVAFGLTIFAIDQEDLYVYELNPDDPHLYRYGDGWEAMRIIRERLEIKGEAAREVELAFTRHGPVLHMDVEAGRAWALRSVWWEPGTSAYFGSARYMRARDWDDFREAVAWWGAPSENLVYADTDGHIGWIAAGRAPIRSDWDGLLPVPGDGRHEWAGFRPQAELPKLFDPPAGWWASANEMNLPPGYPAVGFEWADRSRAQRIGEVLSANDKVSVADCQALQCDVRAAQSRRLQALIAPLQPVEPRLADALDRLRAWDGEESTDSVAAAIYEVWVVKHLGRVLANCLAPAAEGLIGAGLPDAVLDRLERASEVFGADFEAMRDAVLLESLAGALDELVARLGPDPEQWGWGALHHVFWSPAVAVLADPTLKARMDHGAFAAPGSGACPNALAYRPEDFAVNHGASFRMVIDVGAWDESRVVNAPGQSGDPDSAHYGDMMRPWLAGEYVPLLYSRTAIDAAAEWVIRVEPAR